jgi:hypothetical protein
MVIRRYSAVLFVCLFLFLISHEAVAQVFPDREELDVVRLVDGTVLKGVILEEVPDRYLEIQLYGGSTFVLGYGQIESVEREANPDYGMRWIRIELGDPDGAETEATSGEEDEVIDAVVTSRDNRPRPLSAGGHMVSVYSFGLAQYLLRLPIDVGGAEGEYWDDTYKEFGIDQGELEDGNGDNGSMYNGIGFSYLWWRPLGEERSVPWIWGTRGSVGFQILGRGVDEQNRDTEPRDIDIGIGALQIPVFGEGLIGIAGDRTALMVGLGLGAGFTVGAGREYSIGYSDGTADNDGQDEFTVNHPFMYSASLTGLFRLGRRWIVEAGLWANGQFPGAFEEDIVFRGWGERIAIGYRFGGR